MKGLSSRLSAGHRHVPAPKRDGREPRSIYDAKDPLHSVAQGIGSPTVLPPFHSNGRMCRS